MYVCVQNLAIYILTLGIVQQEGHGIERKPSTCDFFYVKILNNALISQFTIIRGKFINI